MSTPVLKTRIVKEARRLGADLIGFAPVSRWREYGELKSDYWPDIIWNKAQTVIVLGVPMLLPIVESTPSINHTVLYDTTNTLLDQMAYRLAVFLNNLGYASIFMPRDGYGSLEILLKKMGQEEEVLRTAFPNEYPEYEQRVKRLLPWVW